MTPISSESVLQQLKWRYAVKKFDSNRQISEGDWQALEQVLVLTPSSWGLQPWKFVVVTDQDVKEDLVAHSYHQNQVAEGSHVVAFAIQEDLSEEDVDRFLEHTASVRGIPVEQLDGFRKVVVGFLAQPKDRFDVNDWSARQVYLALSNFMTSAAMMGIDTCPLEGIVPEKYDETLGLVGTGYRTVVACVAGYRSDEDKYASVPKVRYGHDQVITHFP